MKIGIICYPTHGGSGVVATELGIGLAKRGHEVHFFSYSPPFRLRGFQQNVYYHEVDVSAYPLFKYPPYALSLASKLAYVTREHGLEILHAHYAIPHAASAQHARQMLRSAYPKIITTLHGTDITLVGKDESFFETVKFAIEESDGVTAVSNYLRDRTLKEFGIEREIRTIYNFVDHNRFKRDASACDKFRYAPNNEKLLVHTSNFRPVKRVSDTVRILAKVREAVPVKLLLIGEGPDRQAAHQLAVELGMHNHVLFLGMQDYIENILACADLFLLPSEEESFGLAGLEAMSCGCPVIASKVGGIPEVVDDGVNGYLVPLGNVEAMAAHAVKLLTDDAKMASFRKSAREKAIETFNESKMITEYEKYYEEILNA